MAATIFCLVQGTRSNSNTGGYVRLVNIIGCIVLLSLMGCDGSNSSRESSTLGSVFPSDPSTTPTIAPPSALSAKAISSSQINLTWADNATNESGFKIERKIGVNGTYLQLATAAANTISYNDTGLAASTVYYYRIRATNSVGDSRYTNEVNSTTFANSGGGTGTIKLPKTGQMACYNEAGSVIACAGTGQDGELQIGVAWPNPRFVDNSDQTLTDKLTGLIWTRDANLIKTRDLSFDVDIGQDGFVTWQHALDYIKRLNTDKYLGYNDWRLPNRNELASMVNQERQNSAAWLNAQGFLSLNNVISISYWSGTTSIVLPDSAWIVVMTDGLVGYTPKVTVAGVWPVRSGQPGTTIDYSLTKTGQTTCYNETGVTIACVGTGQDGELQVGLAWPNPRFTVNADQTVTDNMTGLIWSNNGNLAATTKTWQQALDYIKSLNNSSYQGHTDWRLPNRNELESLINQGQANAATLLNMQGFFNVKSLLPYCSSGTIVAYPAGIWGVGMDYGYIHSYEKWGSYYVWPVRGGL
jgi:hypothetical protein